MPEKDQLISKFQACLLGVMIGDSMGMPWETLSHQDILSATDGFGVSGFSVPIQRRIKGTRDLQAGDTTDDWQLTKANAHALIAASGYDQETIAREHVREFETSTFGWGRTTRQALWELKKYFDSNGSEGRSFDTSANEDAGKGCGVAMKIAPIALFMTATEDSFEDLVEVVSMHGTLTHPFEEATESAITLALLFRNLLKDPVSNTRQALQQMEKSVSQRVQYLVELGDDTGDYDTVSQTLIELSEVIFSPDSLREKTGTGFRAREVVPLAIGTFVRNPTDFRAGVLEAINHGGDTDSTASIVGALIGANCGLELIPEEWRTFRQEFQEALFLGEQLYQVAVREE